MQIDIVAVPIASLVLNNRKIYGTQGLKQIMSLMNFGKTESIIGKKLRSSIEITNL